MTDFPLFPPAISAFARNVDALFVYLLLVSAFFSILIATLVVGFAVRFRARPGFPSDQRLAKPRKPTRIATWMLEAFWIVVPLVLTMSMFFWGAHLFIEASEPPEGTLDIFAVGKQWMWKIQHPSGKREIDELHVPMNTPVKIILSSEDVIHSFFIPALRVKQDAVPGRFTMLWFEADRPGRYHLFCAEYCGTKHARMRGTVFVMPEEDYQRFVTQNIAATTVPRTLSRQGQEIFERVGCVTCHAVSPDVAGTKRGPNLFGLFGRQVALTSGQRILANEEYIRESILDPRRKVVAGYPAIMPTYDRILSIEEVAAVEHYIKELGQGQKSTSRKGMP